MQAALHSYLYSTISVFLCVWGAHVTHIDYSESLPQLEMLSAASITQRLTFKEANHAFWCTLDSLIINVAKLLSNPAHEALSKALVGPMCHESGITMAMDRVLKGCRCVHAWGGEGGKRRRWKRCVLVVSGICVGCVGDMCVWAECNSGW